MGHIAQGHRVAILSSIALAGMTENHRNRGAAALSVRNVDSSRSSNGTPGTDWSETEFGKFCSVETVSPSMAGF